MRVYTATEERITSHEKLDDTFFVLCGLTPRLTLYPDGKHAHISFYKDNLQTLINCARRPITNNP